MAAALTRTKKLKNLTDEEYQACYSLNLRHNGLMRKRLSHSFNPSCGTNDEDLDWWEDGREYWENEGKNSYVTLRYNKDGSLAGWALSFPDNYDNLSAYFYVRKSQRRQGVGKSLVAHINKKFGMVRVYPHDETSHNFFNFVHKNKLNVNY